MRFPGRGRIAQCARRSRPTRGNRRHATCSRAAAGYRRAVGPHSAYDSVFRMLLQILVAVTLASALVILGFLGRSPAPAVDASDTEPMLSRAKELVDN